MPDAPLPVEIRELDAQPTACVRLRASTNQLGELFGRHLPALLARIGELGAAPGGPPYGRYYAYGPDEVDVEIGIPLEAPVGSLSSVADLAPGEVGAGELPALRAAVAVHRGSYEGLNATYRRLESWLTANGHSPGDAPWESYIDEAGDMSDMDGVRTLVVWPIG